jgi:hypothetical protein
MPELDTNILSSYSFETIGLSEAAVLCPDLATEGLLWFSNLTIPDTTYILPVTLGLLNLVIIEVCFCNS